MCISITRKNKNINSKPADLMELISNAPQNQIIGDSLIRAWSKINNSKYEKIVCSISGGSDSDVMLDICTKCDKDNKIEYVWFDTGLEYQATKNHLKYLEEKYGINIMPYKAIKPIPLTCKQYGQPFLSKQVSEFMQRLQKYNFKWESDDFDILIKKYCIEISNENAFKNGKIKNGVKEYKGKYYRGCVSALLWWCNKYKKGSKFNVSYNKWLKEFIIENPPEFKISNTCCKYAKKDVVHKLLSDFEYDLNIVGIRKSEGGARSSAYKSCFDENGKSKKNTYDNYRPLFWYKNSDKEEYDKHYEITHSLCYTEYGLKRTGCCCCPYGRDFEYELKITKEYEPKLFTAVNNIFGDSYEYTRKYKEFCKEMDGGEKK